MIKINNVSSERLGVLMHHDSLCKIMSVLGELAYGIKIEDNELISKIGHSKGEIGKVCSSIRQIMDRYDIEL